MEQRAFLELSEHLERLSKNGDPLETLETTVDFDVNVGAKPGHHRDRGSRHKRDHCPLILRIDRAT